MPESADIRDYFRPLWARKWLVLLIVLVGTVGTYFYFDGKPKSYTATTSVFLKPSGIYSTAYGSSGLIGDRDIQNQARLLTSQRVARLVSESSPTGESPSSLLATVTASPAEDSDFIVVKAKRPRAEVAAQVANGFARAYIAFRSAAVRDQASRDLRIAQRQLAALSPRDREGSAGTDLEDRIRNLEVLSKVRIAGAEQVDSARAPSQPTYPRPRRAAAFGFVVALLLAGLLAHLLERLDRRPKRPEDFEAILQKPVLAIVPHSDEPDGPSATGPGVPDGFREPLRSLRTNLQLASLDGEIKLIVITSAVPGEGKSTIARNFAVTCAQTGRRVLLVDCDLRKGTVAERLGHSRQPGLTEVLTGAASLDEAVREVSFEFSGAPVAAPTGAAISRGGEYDSPDAGKLELLPAGAVPSDPPAVLGAARTQEMLLSLAEDRDLVVVDTPPILGLSDAMPLLPVADGVLLVGRLRMTPIDALKRVKTTLGRTAGVNLLGLVVNDERGQSEAYGGYYYDSPNGKP